VGRQVGKKIDDKKIDEEAVDREAAAKDAAGGEAMGKEAIGGEAADRETAGGEAEINPASLNESFQNQTILYVVFQSNADCEETKKASLGMRWPGLLTHIETRSVQQHWRPHAGHTQMSTPSQPVSHRNSK
jgi:hypothetical protein